MKKIVLTCFILSCILCRSSQAQFIQDDQGRPFLSVTYTDVKGHPFFVNQWTEGLVKQNNGKTYSGILLKYDILTDEVFFKDPKSEQTLAFVQPVSEFKLKELGKNKVDLLFRNGYPAFDTFTAKTYYLVLYDGGTQLLKKVAKKINEEKPFNSASIIKSFEELSFYFISSNNKLIKIRKDKKSILTALANHNEALENYIEEKSLNVKNEDDLVQLITYYNTL